MQPLQREQDDFRRRREQSEIHMRILLAKVRGVPPQIRSQEVITGKIVANAGSHKILAALANGPCETKDLKNVVGAINSIARFDGEYMARLEYSGYVKRWGDKWQITEVGRAKLSALGPVGKAKPTTVATSRTTVGEGIYDPMSVKRTPMRPGSEDFLKYPSRMGNELRYRDGRIEEIGESDGY